MTMLKRRQVTAPLKWADSLESCLPHASSATKRARTRGVYAYIRWNRDSHEGRVGIDCTRGMHGCGGAIDDGLDGTLLEMVTRRGERVMQSPIDWALP